MRFKENEDCKECFLKGCDCTCDTCRNAASRNKKLSRLELTRLSVQAGLDESNLSKASKNRVARMLKGQGL
jgi:hypothetical protein